MSAIKLRSIYGGGTHVLKFSSPRCAPCRAAEKIVDKISSDSRFNDIKFWDVNIMDQENMELVNSLNIKGVPVIILIQEGQNKEFLIGGQITEQKLENSLLTILNE